MKRLLILLMGSTIVLTLGAAVVLAGDHDEMTEEQMMEAWMKAATPGAPHQQMADMAGDWKVTTTVHMAPDQPAMETTGTCKRTMMLGGRFMMEEVKSTMMGMPMEGIGINGYNNTTGEYEFIWMDNFGTMIMNGSGTMEGNVLTQVAEYVDPMTGKKAKAKLVTTIVDKDHSTMDMYEMKGGQEMKTMEAKYERVSGSSE